jgi:uncharacterized protein
MHTAFSTRAYTHLQREAIPSGASAAGIGNEAYHASCSPSPLRENLWPPAHLMRSWHIIAWETACVMRVLYKERAPSPACAIFGKHREDERTMRVVTAHCLENIQMKDLYVTWDEYHRLIEQLALQIHASGYRFDSLLCLARGGLRIGDMISRLYAMPLAILAVSSYRGAAGTQQGQLAIAESITTTGDALHGKVLLVDDLVDSGVTLTRVVAHVQQCCRAITEVRTAVLWYKAASKYKPDYYVLYLPTSPWIHQPFEEYDTLYPYQLATRLHSEKG